MALRRIILHIGRHKSGTSSLQHFLKANRSYLSQHGILYPQAGIRDKAPAHHKLAKLCATSDGEALDRVVQDLLAEIRPNHETLILSSEEFQNLSSAKAVQYFLKQLPKAEVEIVCYVREFSDYMVSSYRQAVQNQGKFQSFTTFCKNRYPARGFIRRWRKMGRLDLGWFHPNLLKDGDIVADFMAKVELPLPDNYTAVNRNPSLGGNLLWMKLVANYYISPFLTYGNMNKALEERAEFTRPFYLSNKRASALRYRSRYNRTFEKLIGPVPFKSWEDGIVLPDATTLDADLEFLGQRFEHVNLSLLRLDPTFGRDWF